MINKRYAKSREGICEMDIVVKEITPEDAYEVRREVLSAYQTIKEFEYDYDYSPHSFHLGAYLDDKLVSVASFFRQKSSFFEEESQYRLRAMATLKEYRNMQAGTAIMKKAEKMLKQRYTRLVWCYVSEPVSDYYTQFGFREYDQVFVVESIGPHKVMYKIL